jgi:HTH-type transcriptional regulator/antitoxin HigA
MEALSPINDEEAYDAALAKVETYFVKEPKRGSPEADHFMVLTDLITAYEAKVWPIDVDDDPLEEH